MGRELATSGPQYTVGKQTLASAERLECSVPGKVTLTEALASSPQGDLERVAARAGQHVIDKGRFEYVAQRDGSFRIVNAPAPFTDSKDKSITLAALPGVWGILHDLLLAQRPAALAPGAAKPTAPRKVATPEEIAANDKRVRGTKKRTLDGATLDIAQTRADLGDKGTHYRREDASAAEIDQMVTGSEKAATFWCSGFSMWTLRAAGYDLDSEVVGSDGKPFTFTEIAHSKDPAVVAKGRLRANLMKQVADAKIELAADEFPTWGRITFRGLIDGHGMPVMLMAKVDREQLEHGVWLGVFRAPANTFAGLLDGPGGPERAATGAAGAFELLGIGRMVSEAEQKPGDFAQERWLVDGAYNGAGHAFQIWSVTARGSAVLGKERSPVALDNPAQTGWAEGVLFRITKDTDPGLVGAHEVIAAQRIEANIEGAFAADKQTKGGDGGVQIKGEQPVPNVNKLHKGTKIFIGRLGTSPWADWTPAVKASDA